MTFAQNANAAGGVLPVVNVARPSTLEAQMKELIELTKKLVPSSPIEQVDSSQSDNTSESIIEIDVSSVNTDLHVPLSIASRRLTFLSWPPSLQQLEIKINKPGAQRLDVLCNNPFERSNGISKIFVTSRPAIPNGRVRALVGDLIARPRANCFGYNNVLPVPFQGIGDNQETLDVSSLLPFDGPVRICHQSDRTSTANPFTNIPRFTLIRVHGEITSEDQAVAGSIMAFQVRVHVGGDFFWQKDFKGHIGGEQQWQYDSGWFWCDGALDPSFNFIVNDIGPVGNVLSINGYLEIIPNIPPV